MKNTVVVIEHVQEQPPVWFKCIIFPVIAVGMVCGLVGAAIKAVGKK